jgi:hypothetical protein
MADFLMQLIPIPFWLVCGFPVVTLSFIGLLLSQAGRSSFDAESREAWVEQLEQRVMGLLTTNRGRSLWSLERRLGIGYFDGAAKAELQALLGRLRTRGKVKVDARGYRLAR